MEVSLLEVILFGLALEASLGVLFDAFLGSQLGRIIWEGFAWKAAQFQTRNKKKNEQEKIEILMFGISVSHFLHVGLS